MFVFEPFKDNGKWCFWDWETGEELPGVWDHAWDFGEGLAPVRQDGKCGYIDLAGNLVLP